MKSVFSAILLYSSDAKSNKKHFFRPRRFQTGRGGVYRCPGGKNIVHHQHGQTRNIFPHPESPDKIAFPLRRSQFLLRSCILNLDKYFSETGIPRVSPIFRARYADWLNPRIRSFLFVKRNRDDHIGSPPADLSADVSAYFLPVIVSVFPASVIFVSYKRPSHDAVVEKNSPSAVERAGSFPAFPAVFFIRFYRLSAFQAVMPAHRPECISAFRADGRSFVFQDPVAYRTAPRIKNVEDTVKYFFNQDSFLPDAACSISFTPPGALCQENCSVSAVFSFLIISRKVSSLPTMVTHFLALVTAVYRRFLFRSIFGPERTGITTAGYSDPWDLCIVTA